MIVKRLLAVILFVGFALAACSSSPSGDDAGYSPTEAPISAASIKLEPGDKVHLTVFGEESISGDYEIDSEGFISVPLAGLVKAGGLRKVELEKKIAEMLSGLIKDPRVTASVVSFRPFYILGEVEKPGQYDFKSGLNVVSAMAIAGGATYRANRGHVLIQRGGVGKFQEFPMSPEIKVYPGDLIKVPERFF